MKENNDEFFAVHQLLQDRPSGGRSGCIGRGKYIQLRFQPKSFLHCASVVFTRSSHAGRHLESRYQVAGCNKSCAKPFT